MTTLPAPASAHFFNLLHNGTESVKIVMFAMGSKDTPFSIVAPAPVR